MLYQEKYYPTQNEEPGAGTYLDPVLISVKFQVYSHCHLGTHTYTHYPDRISVIYSYFEQHVNSRREKKRQLYLYCGRSKKFTFKESTLEK